MPYLMPMPMPPNQVCAGCAQNDLRRETASIPGPRHGLDVSRFGPVALQLRAERTHMPVDDLALADEVAAPECVQDLPARERAPGVRGEEVQQSLLEMIIRIVAPGQPTGALTMSAGWATTQAQERVRRAAAADQALSLPSSRGWRKIRQAWACGTRYARIGWWLESCSSRSQA